MSKKNSKDILRAAMESVSVDVAASEASKEIDASGDPIDTSNAAVGATPQTAELAGGDLTAAETEVKGDIVEGETEAGPPQAATEDGGEGDVVEAAAAAADEAPAPIDEAAAAEGDIATDASDTDTPEAAVIPADGGDVAADAGDAEQAPPAVEEALPAEGDAAQDLSSADAEAAAEAALDADKEVAVVADGEDASIVIEDERPTAEVEAEIVETEGEISELEDTAEEVEEVQAGLESIAAAMQASLAEGGLSPQAATWAGVAVESYAKRIGEDGSVLVPAAENFGGGMTRIDATEMAMESVRETANKVWEALKRIWNRIREFVAKMWKAVMTAAGRLGARADQLAKRVAAVKGDAVGEIDNAGLAKALAVGGKLNVVEGSTIVANAYSETRQLDEATYAELKQKMDILRKIAGSEMQNLSQEEILRFGGSKARTYPTIFNSERGGKRMTPVLPGNVRFSLKEEKAHNIRVGQYDIEFKGRFSLAREAAEASGSPKLKVLSAADMRIVVTNARRLADSATKKDASGLSEGRDSLNIDKVPVNVDKNWAHKAAVHTLMSRFQGDLQMINAGLKAVGAYSVISMGRHLDAVEASLKQYETKKAA